MKYLIVALATLSLMACTDKSSNNGSSGSQNNGGLTQQNLAECPQDIVGTYQRSGSGNHDRDDNEDYTGYNNRGYQGQRPQPPIYQPQQPQPQPFPPYQHRGSTTVTQDPSTGVLIVSLEGRDYIRTDGIPRQSGSGEALVYSCSRGQIIGRSVNGGRRRGGHPLVITMSYNQMQVRTNGGPAEIYRRIR